MEKSSTSLVWLLLTLATLYTLSFNWASKSFEAKAALHGEYVADSLEGNNLLGSDMEGKYSPFKVKFYVTGVYVANVFIINTTAGNVQKIDLNLT